MADEYARAREVGWTCTKYLGHYHEIWCDAEGPAWLTFMPIEDHGDDHIDGLVHYIFINEEELVYLSSLGPFPYKHFTFGAAIHEERQKIVAPKTTPRRKPRHEQYVVAITY